MTHSFNTDDAAKYGLPQAVILYNIRYWIEYNKAHRENIQDGRVWTYNSVRAYGELFPYLTTDQIRRYIESLEKAGAVICGSYNKRGGDRTKWHSLPGDEGLAPGEHLAELPTHLANPPQHLAKMPNGNGEFAKALPDINSDINSYEKHTQERAAARVCAPDNPLDVELPEPETIDLSPIAEPLQLYADKCFKFSRTAIDASLLHACHTVGVETVRLALLQCVQLCEDPAFEKRYLPQLTKLLNSSDDLHKRAALWRPPTEPRASPIDAQSIQREIDAQTVAWLSGLSDEEREFQFSEARRLNQTWGDGVYRLWPQSQNLKLQTA